jgi:hypothetical protein
MEKVALKGVPVVGWENVCGARRNPMIAWVSASEAAEGPR